MALLQSFGQKIEHFRPTHNIWWLNWQAMFEQIKDKRFTKVWVRSSLKFVQVTVYLFSIGCISPLARALFTKLWMNDPTFARYAKCWKKMPDLGKACFSDTVLDENIWRSSRDWRISLLFKEVEMECCAFSFLLSMWSNKSVLSVNGFFPRWSQGCIC